MEMYFAAKVGGNAKTGLLTSTSSKDTCPDICPLKGKGCYARFGNLSRTWENVSNGKWTMEFSAFLNRIKMLPEGSLWRHNQAGDLPGINLAIDGKVLSQIVEANKVKGVYAGACSDVYAAERLVKSNNAQVLCLGALVTGVESAKSIVAAWLASEFQGGRSKPKVERIKALEAEVFMEML